MPENAIITENVEKKNKSKFYVISGVDGTGKETQCEALASRFKEMGYKVRRISYPVYNSWGASLVEGFLDGKLGKDLNDLNVYGTSIFYSADRFIDLQNWIDDYNDPNTIVIADRYTPDNILYGAVRIMMKTGCNSDDVKDFIEWIQDLEYNRFKLPRPDKVIMLTMNKKLGRAIRDGRNSNKHTGDDIMESNNIFLDSIYDSIAMINQAYNLGWNVIDVSDSIQNCLNAQEYANKWLRYPGLEPEYYINTSKELSIREINDSILTVLASGDIRGVQKVDTLILLKFSKMINDTNSYLKALNNDE